MTFYGKREEIRKTVHGLNAGDTYKFPAEYMGYVKGLGCSLRTKGKSVRTQRISKEEGICLRSELMSKGEADTILSEYPHYSEYRELNVAAIIKNLPPLSKDKYRVILNRLIAIDKHFKVIEALVREDKLQSIDSAHIS